MEQMIEFAGSKILLTTGASKEECQQWEWWEEADVVIGISAGRAILLKQAAI